MALRARVTGDVEAPRRAFSSRYEPIAKAATAAMQDAADELKLAARADIVGAGFSQRFANALRVDRFPRGGRVSANPAAFLFHKIGYSGVFEDGAVIRGKPHLFLPLPGVPQKVSGKRMRPLVFESLVGDLVSIRGAARPLLGAKVRLSRSNARRTRPKLTLAALKRGAAGAGILRTVPVFVGVPAVTIAKRFHIAEIARGVAGRLARAYARHFRDE